jgi:hypothetical protein
MASSHRIMPPGRTVPALAHIGGQYFFSRATGQATHECATDPV